MMNLDKALAVMEMAAIGAARILGEIQSKSRRLESSKDFLTDADLTSEEVILRALAAEYPEIPALSEEKGGAEAKEGYLWIVDPVDGSINFFLQDDHWGISIALAENGHTIAGVVCLPARKQLFSASRDTAARVRFIDEGESAWRNLCVTRQDILASSQFWVEWGKEGHGGDDHKRVLNIIEKLDSHTLYPQIRNSVVASMMAVAYGKIAGCVLPRPEPVDIAAAGLIVERAGGTVTDMDGSPWGPFSRSLVASNGVLHDEILRIIKAR